MINNPMNILDFSYLLLIEQYGWNKACEYYHTSSWIAKIYYALGDD